MSADYEVRGSIAVITMNNPPVNGLGHATRSGIFEGLKKALADGAVKAVVITGAGKAFSGGADIKEFNTPKTFAEPNLLSVIAAIEAADKPVVAAIHSVAMGGGLELALGCHYRVASPGAQIALPEVKLGLLPGAGGTQRLPRVVGVETALNMIVTGNPLLSEKLAGTKLFDRMIMGDLIAGAIAFAGEIAEKRPLPKVRDVKIELSNREAFFKTARATVGAASKHFPAPLKCVDSVEAAVTLPFEEGMKVERENFLTLVQTTESKALRHYFFGERAASKIPDVPEDTPKRPIKSAAVVGSGTMGGGIAMNFANAGIPVVVLEVNQEMLDKGLATVRRNYESSLKKGRLTQEKFDQLTALIRGTLSYDEIKNADIVIEAVFEEMGVKETTFYCLSLENFNRPKIEFDYLMKLFEKESKELFENKMLEEEKMRINFIGRLYMFPKSLQEVMKNLMDKTKDNKLFTFNFAIGYGGRTEVVDAVKKIAEQVKTGKLEIESINEETFAKNLYFDHEPDLIIRTGGEVRTSNFLPYQSTYSEWIFVDKLFPEFEKEDFLNCLTEFENRERRFGK